MMGPASAGATTPSAAQSSVRGPIVIRRRDAERLHQLAADALLRSPRDAGALLDELLRASVCPDDVVPDDIIGLGAKVLIAQSVRGGSRNRRCVLVEPAHADRSGSSLSVLTPLGAALLGLGPGDWVRFPDRCGGVEHFVVLEAFTTPASLDP